MTVSNLEKEINPLPWILATMLGGVILIGGVTYTILNRPNSATRLSEYTVAVTPQTLNVKIQASGTVEPIQSVNISPKNPGRLVKLLVDQGVMVKAGQPIAVMENQELYVQGVAEQAQLKQAIANFEESKISIPGEIQQAQMRFEQAKANLKETEARLQQAKERIPGDIKQNQAQLESAKSRFGLAQVRLQRNQQLLKEGAISQDQYDESWNEYLSAGANLGEFQQRLQQTESTASPEIQQLEQAIIQQQATVAEAKIAFEQRKQTAEAELAQLQAAAEVAKANLEKAKIQFQDTIIRAPFDGIITQRYATEGAFVTPTTSASNTASATSTSIVALARGLEIIAKVPEINLEQIRLGQPVEIVADAYPNQIFKGIVKSVAPEAIIEQNVTSFEVKIAIITGQDQLLSKMNVETTFLGEPRSNVLVVPTVAIVTEEGKTGVMIPDENGKPEFKPVSIGTSVDDKTEILTGLTAGERVFIDLPEK